MQYWSPSCYRSLSVWSLYVLSVLTLVSAGFSHKTYRTGELETVVSVKMNVCDGLAICPGCFLRMTHKRL